MNESGIRQRTILLVGLPILLVAGVLTMWALSNPRTWNEGETHGAWTVRYTGFGMVEGTGRR